MQTINGAEIASIVEKEAAPEEAAEGTFTVPIAELRAALVDGMKNEMRTLTTKIRNLANETSANEDSEWDDLLKLSSQMRGLNTSVRNLGFYHPKADPHRKKDRPDW